MPASVSWVSTFSTKKLENGRPSRNTSRHCPKRITGLSWAYYFWCLFCFFLVSGTRPPGTTKKELKCRPSRNTSRHCPNASPAYLESIIWPRVTQPRVSKISKFVFFVTFLDVLFFVGSWTSLAKAKMIQKSDKKESEGMLWERFLIEGGKGSKKWPSRSPKGGFSLRRRCIFHFFALAWKRHQKGRQKLSKWVPGPQSSGPRACRKWLLAMPARVSWVSTFFTKKMENGRPSQNTGRHCPNASPA